MFKREHYQHRAADELEPLGIGKLFAYRGGTANAYKTQYGGYAADGPAGYPQGQLHGAERQSAGELVDACRDLLLIYAVYPELAPCFFGLAEPVYQHKHADDEKRGESEVVLRVEKPERLIAEQSAEHGHKPLHNAEGQRDGYALAYLRAVSHAVAYRRDEGVGGERER